MRRLTKITIAAAPLALLAACGGNEADETAIEEPVETTAAVDPANDAAPTTLVDAGDFSGSYNYTADDGTARNLTLDASDDSYEYTADDGTVRSGNYARMDDGYRFEIVDYYGGPGYFTYSGGSIYQLEDDTFDSSQITVTGTRFDRTEGDSPPDSGMVNSIQDKRE